MKYYVLTPSQPDRNDKIVSTSVRSIIRDELECADIGEIFTIEIVEMDKEKMDIFLEEDNRV
jgi:hypothetical protein